MLPLTVRNPFALRPGAAPGVAIRARSVPDHRAGAAWVAVSSAAAETWTVTVSLNFARRAQTATLLPTTRSWRRLGGAPAAPSHRRRSTRPRPSSGVPPDPWRYRATTTPKPCSPTARFSLPEAFQRDGDVRLRQRLVGGALRSHHRPMDAHRLHGNAARQPHRHRLPNGRVLVAGGITNFPLGGLASAELYDPATRTWLPTVDDQRPGEPHRDPPAGWPGSRCRFRPGLARSAAFSPRAGA